MYFYQIMNVMQRNVSEKYRQRSGQLLVRNENSAVMELFMLA